MSNSRSTLQYIQNSEGHFTVKIKVKVNLLWYLCSHWACSQELLNISNSHPRVATLNAQHF